jgi:putative nucleotidyltransferase with HDIG domain
MHLGKGLSKIFLVGLPSSIRQLHLERVRFSWKAFPAKASSLPPTWLRKRFQRIGVKLPVFFIILMVAITWGSSLVVIRIMDKVLLQSLVRRGASISLSVAVPAGYSILSGDRLALDNLAAKIEETQDDVAYVAILNVEGTILAHNHLDSVGKKFEPAGDPPISEEGNLTVRETFREGQACYEFQTPVLFSGSQVGQVMVGLKADTLAAAISSARHKIFWISILALVLGGAGTLLFTTVITAPIKRLAAGVSRIKEGDYRVKVKAVSRDELGELTLRFNEMAQVISNQKDRLETYAKTLEESYVSTVRILAAALDARDKYTLGHSSRVAKLSLAIGKGIGLDEEELNDLEMACFLHDIGKIRVPDLILNKATPLTPQEYQIIMKHPEHGAEILRLAESLHKYVPTVLHHHEWFNGGGYPHGLKGEDIHLFAQIVAIADSYDAITSSRPYRKGRSRKMALEEIKNCKGTQFAPPLVDVFIESLHTVEDPVDPRFVGLAI